jgi:hypothetical protein
MSADEYIIHVERNAQTGMWYADNRAIGYGMGNSPFEAVRDMLDCAEADFDKLSAHPGALSPPLQRRLAVLRACVGGL